jgi:hypothetical protein
VEILTNKFMILRKVILSTKTIMMSMIFVLLLSFIFTINAYSNEIYGSTTGSALINAAISQGTNATYADLVSKINATANLSQTIPSVGTYSAINPVTYNNTITTVTGSLLRDAPNFRYYGSASLSISGSKQTYNNSDVFSRNDAGIMSVVFRAINPFTSGTETWIFPAYMNGYKDDFNATWNDVNYAGRAESFYIYSKFKRTVNFNLKILFFSFLVFRLRSSLQNKHQGVISPQLSLLLPFLEKLTFLQ